jgi:hypothetical protein
MEDVQVHSQTRGDADATRNGRVVVALVVAFIAAIVTYFALGMPGMDHGGSTDAPHQSVDGEHNP